MGKVVFNSIEDVLSWKETLRKSKNAGAMRPDEFRLLYKLITDQKPEYIFECGTCFGISAIVSAFALYKSGGNKLITFDPRDRGHIFNLAPEEIRNKIQFIQDKFDAAAPRVVRRTRSDLPIFVTIDGNHAYNWVKRDFYAILPYLKEGDKVVFHDTISFKDDVGKFMEELLTEGKYNLTLQYGALATSSASFGCCAAKPLTASFATLWLISVRQRLQESDDGGLLVRCQAQVT